MTAAGKITTARLTPGARILVQRLDDGRVDIAFRKTGALVATVERVDVAPAGPYGRQSRRVVHTDLGSIGCSPSQTHMLAPAPAPVVVEVDLSEVTGGRVSNSADHVV